MQKNLNAEIIQTRLETNTPTESDTKYNRYIIRAFMAPIDFAARGLNIASMLPSAEEDYNQHVGLYDKNFSRPFTDNYLPKCIECSEDISITEGFRPPKILDLGCGLAPMGLALLKYQIACSVVSKISPEIQYVGIDIRKDAVEKCQKRYADYDSFKFVLHDTDCNLDYIGKNFENKGTQSTLVSSDGSECKYSLDFEFQADIQWSCSLFTHLTIEGAKKALEFTAKSITQSGISVNTWMLADGMSLLGMTGGAADRCPEAYMNQTFVISKNNPLLCTIHRLDLVRKLYAQAGLEIIKIERGSWRGGSYKNSFNHNQDIIVAKRADNR